MPEKPVTIQCSSEAAVIFIEATVPAATSVVPAAISTVAAFTSTPAAAINLKSKVLSEFLIESGVN